MGWIIGGKTYSLPTSIPMVEKTTRQGRRMGCHRMFAAKHLIFGVESVK